jgi:hypothetical protein
MHRWRARGHRLARRTRGTAECTAVRRLPLPRKEVRKPPTLSEPRAGRLALGFRPSRLFGSVYNTRSAGPGVCSTMPFMTSTCCAQCYKHAGQAEPVRARNARAAPPHTAAQPGTASRNANVQRCQCEQDRFHASTGAYDTSSSKTSSSPSSSSHWVPVWRKPSLRASAREARFVGAILATK